MKYQLQYILGSESRLMQSTLWLRVHLPPPLPPRIVHALVIKRIRICRSSAAKHSWSIQVVYSIREIKETGLFTTHVSSDRFDSLTRCRLTPCFKWNCLVNLNLITPFLHSINFLKHVLKCSKNNFYTRKINLPKYPLKFTDLCKLI